MDLSDLAGGQTAYARSRGPGRESELLPRLVGRSGRSSPPSDERRRRFPLWMRASVRAVCAPGREQSRARMRVGEADQRSDGAAAGGAGRAREHQGRRWVASVPRVARYGWGYRLPGGRPAGPNDRLRTRRERLAHCLNPTGRRRLQPRPNARGGPQQRHRRTAADALTRGSERR